MLALLALCLRLVWPSPPVPAAPDTGFLAALGEHAMCLAVPVADRKAPLPRERNAPQPNDHADHDSLSCCLWHAAAAITLPQVGAAVGLAVIETRTRVAIAAGLASSRDHRPAQARAPPARS
jgi:hypothetical protein